MELASTSAASSQSTASRVDSTVNEARETALSDFNDFLTLLTAQLKNQDPLQPLDSTQFVEQLASFAAVEQQVGANEKLTRLIDQGAATEMSELGGWIGRTVEANKAMFALTDKGISLTVPQDVDATSVEAVITDESGEIVAHVPITKPDEPFQWSGELANGRQASSGYYGVSFAYTFDGRDDSLLAAQGSGQVVEARIDDDGPILLLDSGAVVRPADIEALRVKAEAETASSET